MKVQAPAFNDKGDLDKTRKYAKEDGNLNNALRGHADDLSMMKSIMNELVDGMSTGDALKLSLDTFKPATDMHEDKTKQANYESKYREVLEDAFHNAFNKSDFVSMMKSRTADKKVREEIGKIWTKDEKFNLQNFNPKDYGELNYTVSD